MFVDITCWTIENVWICRYWFQLLVYAHCFLFLLLVILWYKIKLNNITALKLICINVWKFNIIQLFFDLLLMTLFGKRVSFFNIAGIYLYKNSHEKDHIISELSIFVWARAFRGYRHLNPNDSCILTILCAHFLTDSIYINKK